MIAAPFRGRLSPLLYPLLASALILVQYGAVFLAFRRHGAGLGTDLEFWLLPLRKLGSLSDLTGTDAMLVIVAVLLSYAALAASSFRRAARSALGFGLAVFSILPALQIGAVLILTFLPVSNASTLEETEAEAEAERPGANVAHVLQGLFAGMALIVLAVLVSAVTFGAYGWGLFVMTPFLVGFTTAYLANRRNPLDSQQSAHLVLAATALGALALVLLALEGVVCIFLLAPLVVGIAFIGGVIGRGMALDRNARDKPLRVIALLPAVFALEAAVPPQATFETRESIDIAAPPASVWGALTSDSPIAVDPGLVASAGLAYPVRGRLLGRGIGASRLGYFSTGVARERVTAWRPGRLLAFQILVQPPAMEEMSPYRRVHAPHVYGYFETTGTRFELEPRAGGGTRLTIRASHILRIDPIPYWEPLARWTVHSNTARVLEDIKAKAEAAR